jgi:hypothetical protein
VIAKDPTRELRRLFAGMIEQAFCSDLGVCAPDLTEYLSDLLADFVHVDCIYRVRAVDGQTIREISRMYAEGQLGPDADKTYRERLIHRYIGDFALFWTGMYPEMLRPRQCGVDLRHEYRLQGRRGYEVASELSRVGDTPTAELLHELSAQFECCARGLFLVRQGWGPTGRNSLQN